ncbi:serine hydrolase [Pseudoduganella umbonata]|uniref:CubicO group peptidase (Beta-lactamase class C family) n=1 Tax=Pseudoduganella umbonata TaxID=864828 RepID=A0A4P8HZ72_9BURK|nr:serine hydrolase [Pseudoduganella umbonata]MBB3223358.1 CubicO group peptidase (beta-lactamase class C family) [Pseudoduganella umbonata]QCP13735.1 serine hydrolase [Pseudoduganella umbonata]
MFQRSAAAVIVLSALCLQAPFAAAQSDPVRTAPVRTAQEPLAAGIDALLAPHFRADAPGVTVIATKDGKTVFRKAYGLADVAAKQPLAPQAVLRLGSITKQFTAVGILMLADEGRLALSDDITRFLPDYPTGGRVVTVEHLLTHTSGIVSYTSKKDFGEVMMRDVSVAQGIDYFKNDTPESAPGSAFSYNNSGYFLLGAIIEKVSGQSYARFLEERIFKPLGMAHTGYEGSGPALKPVPGYGVRDGHPRPAEPLSMAWPYAAGALVSNVDDLARWQAALADGKLVRPETLRRAFTPFTLADGKAGPYGYGWFVGQLHGTPLVFHGGNINGFATDAVWLPNERIYVAVLANNEAGAGAAPLDKLTRQVAMRIAGKPLPQPSNAKLDTATLAAYAGVYRIDDKTSLTVRPDGGSLSMQRTSRPPMPLRHYKADGFLIGDSLTTVDFTRDATGAVTALMVTGDRGVNVHRRMQAAAPAQPPGSDVTKP